MLNLTEAITDLRTALTEKSEPAGSEKSWGDDDRSAPKTPWGPAQQGYVIDNEVIFYGTAGHGGLRVSKKAAKKLTDAAKKFGQFWGGAYWYEEDVAIEIPFYEVESWRKSASKWFGAGAGWATPESYVKVIERYFPEYLKLAADGYKEPVTPKIGETWEFTEPLSYGVKFGFEKGDQIQVAKLTSAGLVFMSSKYPTRFRLRTSSYNLLAKVEK